MINKKEDLQIVMFAQLEEKGKPDIRYVCAGFLEHGLFTGYVNGYEGGGEYSDEFFINSKPAQDDDSDEPWEDFDFEEKLEEKYNSMYGHDDEPVQTFLEKCYCTIETIAEFSQETMSYQMKDEVLKELTDRNEIVYSTFPEGVKPVSYASTTFE